MKLYKKWGYVGVCIVLIIGLWISTKLFIHFHLNGEKMITLNYGDTYEELGASATCFGKELKVIINHNINLNKLGEYTVTYEARNVFGISKKVKRKVIVLDRKKPVITLKGTSSMTIPIGTNYIEPGYDAIDENDGNITKNVKINGTINSKEVGIYELVYQVQDKSGNEATTKRIIHVVNNHFEYKNSYDNIDNKQNGWWSNNKFDGVRPTGGAPLEELKKYDTYFLGPDEKVIYLTYDEGSNETYLKEIVQVLNQNNVKATFFLCKNYILSNPDLMKEMVKTGHSVGNHTHRHLTMPSLATRSTFDKYVAEITSTEDAFKEVTGVAMDKVYREPRGEWSYRSLQIVKDMGYRSFFWSADYLDWDGDVSKEVALEKLLKRVHNGAIYLMHPKNKGNYEALDSMIKELKKQGYRFDLVKNINY